MIKVCGVKFKNTGKVYYFDPIHGTFNRGDEVVVETSRGRELGIVAFPPFEIKEEDLTAPLKPIIALATEEEKNQYLKYKLMAEEAFITAKEKIRERNLDMKLIEVEYTLDGTKIIFYFSSKERIDFRELVKDLAAIFKRRIEMHQIGVRDEAKSCGGLGPCGRQACCCSFLSEFSPVSITMAKDQNLSLNPTKISGACGRLMCCLAYEENVYKENLKKMPHLDTEVIYQDKIARVIGLNVLKGSVRIEIFENREKLEVTLEEIRKATQEDRKNFAEVIKQYESNGD